MARYQSKPSKETGKMVLLYTPEKTGSGFGVGQRTGHVFGDNYRDGAEFSKEEVQKEEVHGEYGNGT